MSKISYEVAEVEFERFANAMDIDIDTDGMSDEEIEDLAKLKGKLLRAIQAGNLIVNDNGEFVYTPYRSDVAQLTFYEPTGAALMAMDRKKKSEDMAKLYATMADITKTSISNFSKMKMADLKICIAITTLFLA